MCNDNSVQIFSDSVKAAFWKLYVLNATRLVYFHFMSKRHAARSASEKCLQVSGRCYHWKRLDANRSHFSRNSLLSLSLRSTLRANRHQIAHLSGPCGSCYLYHEKRLLCSPEVTWSLLHGSRALPGYNSHVGNLSRFQRHMHFSSTRLHWMMAFEIQSNCKYF